MPSIYRKTPKGQAEIETRAHKLPPRLRTTLIMVNGQRSLEELRPLLLQAPEEALAALLDQGFIEAVAGTASASPAAPAQPTVPPGATSATPATRMAVPLPVRQREAVRLLTDQVGPMAEALAVRMEKARSADELRAVVILGAQVIANTRGRQAAEAFMARFADL